MRVKGLMRMQRIGQNGGLCHGEQKANSYNSTKNSLKTSVIVVVIYFIIEMPFIDIKKYYLVKKTICKLLKYTYACAYRIITK